jgi:glucokinase
MRALGIDLGGTKALGCLVDEAGGVAARTTRPTGRATGPATALRLVVSIAEELGRGPGSFDAVGIGFPGLVDARRGVARSSVMLDGWYGVPLGKGVADVLRVPCFVDNDVNTAALAELAARGGGPRGAMVFVAVGTGIGGAIAIDGRLFRGASGTAGEIGNMTISRDGPACWCGRRGCLNTLASGTAIERSLGSAPGSLGSRGGERDARVRAAVREAAQALGAGLANVVNLLNPSLVCWEAGFAGSGGSSRRWSGRPARRRSRRRARGARSRRRGQGTKRGPSERRCWRDRWSHGPPDSIRRSALTTAVSSPPFPRASSPR